ncbi:Tripartite tricarboxylate transporter family receptor [Mycobacteroides abscessus subsp. abscessus]|nr:Tripartite tricarboxylate transporter family receptor [Mycobacteroides abscessus subsp. abscessus]
MKELVDFSIKSPEKANYGASAASFQLVSELFNSKTGAKFTRIPYKGSNESVQAVMAGDVTMTLVDPGPASTALQADADGIGYRPESRIVEWRARAGRHA